MRIVLAVLCVSLLGVPPVMGGDDGRPLAVPVDDDPAPDAEPPTPPAGLVYVPGGAVRIGTSSEELAAELAGRPAEIRRLFRFETPRHTRTLRPYFIGKHEVTNAQYAVFLRDHRRTYDTSDGSLANLDEIAAYLTGMSPDMRKGRAQRVWEQLYFANKDAIWAAFGERLSAMLVRKGGAVDERATAARFRREPLPPGIRLVFQRYAPPTNWLGDRPLTGLENHPVRFVTYNAVERFAEWAGVRLPTEFEWEWAARGSEAWRFPWGHKWFLTASHANWGGKIVDIRFEPMSLPVASRPNGRSWCGCRHMCGNVAEWTSSWFQPYPGNTHTSSLMGTYVKVIRGGCAADGDTLVLRSACRNVSGAGPNARPFPDNRFKWVGFRLAAHLDPVRDTLGPIVRRATRANRLKRPRLDLSRYTGAVTREWLEPGAEPVNGVFALGRAHAVAFVPCRALLTDEQKAAPFKTPWKLASRTRTEHPGLVLGVLHTSLPLMGLQIAHPEGIEPGRRRRRPRAPPTQEGTAAAGTYLLGLWWERLALLSPSMDFVGFLPPREGKPFTLAKRAPADRTPTLLRVEPEIDRAELSIELPVGGMGQTDALCIETGLRLRFLPGELEAAGTWMHARP